MIGNSGLIGIGLYSVGEAAKMLAQPASKLSRWADGYTFRLRDEMRFSEPVICTQLKDIAGTRILTFLDLMELHFVVAFREYGISMKRIRDAARIGMERFNSDHPFAVKRFQTDGHRIFAALEQRHRNAAMEELTQDQLVFDTVVRPFFKNVELYMDQIARYWPIGKDRRIVIDPARSFGKPIDDETGMQTFTLYQASLSGESVRDVANWYGIPLGAVRSSIEYERSLMT